jgi:DNA primase catalytic subunit
MKKVLIKAEVDLVFDLDLWETELSDAAVVQICIEMAREILNGVAECERVSVIGSETDKGV